MKNRDYVKPTHRWRRAHDDELFETAQKMIADFERRTTARGLETTHKDQDHNKPDNKQVTRNRSRNRRDACRGTFS